MTDEKIAKVAESHWLTALNRVVTPILLGIMAWLGLQVWSDLKAVGSDVTTIKVNQAVSDTKLNDALRRLDRLEVQRSGALTPSGDNRAATASRQ